MSLNQQLHSDGSLFLSPNYIKSGLSLTSQPRIEENLFPIPQEMIEKFQEERDRINNLLNEVGLKEVSEHDIKLLQAFIRGNNTSSEIIAVENIFDKNVIVCLQIFLEIYFPTEERKSYQDFFGTQEVNGKPTQAELDRVLKRIKAGIKAHEIIEKISKK